MSQCHDTHDPLKAHGSVDLKGTSSSVSAGRCHDSYECIGSTAVTGDHHECHFVHRHRDGACLIRIVGKIDWATAGRLGDLMSTPSGSVVVINLSRSSTDVAGTAVLICAIARAKDRGHRVAIVLNDAPQFEVLRAAGLDSVIPVVQSEPEALRLLAHSPVVNQARPRVPSEPSAGVGL